MPRTIIPWPAGVNAIAPLSPAVLADGVLYVSGTLAFGADGQITAVGDIRGQTRVILGDIQTLLTTVGGTLADVTMNQIFLKSWSDYSAFNEVYLEYFPVGFPARFCIVCDLVRPEALVEIASVAHIGQRPSASDSA